MSTSNQLNLGRSVLIGFQTGKINYSFHFLYYTNLFVIIIVTISYFISHIRMENSSTTFRSHNMSSPYLPSKAEGIAWCSAFILEAVLIVLANLLALLLFAVNKRLRKRSLFLVINMAFANLLSGALSLTIFIYTVGAGFMLWKARFDKAFYAYQVFCETVVLQASLFSASLVTCERFYAVYWPLKHRTLSVGAYRAAIFMVWIIAILFSILQLLTSNKPAFYTFVSILLIQLFTLCIGNIAIWRRFQRRIASQQQNREAQNRRLTRTLLLISAVEILSWLPLTISNLLVIAFEIPVPLAVLFTCVALNYSNFFLNPIIYALRFPEFKQALDFCCHRSHDATMNVEGSARNNNVGSNADRISGMQTLGLCCCRSRNSMNTREGGERNYRVHSLRPTTLSTNSSDLQLAFEQEVMDTRL